MNSRKLAENDGQDDQEPVRDELAAQQQWEEEQAAQQKTGKSEWEVWWEGEQERRRQEQINRNLEEFYRPDLARQRRQRHRRFVDAIATVFVQGIPYE